MWPDFSKMTNEQLKMIAGLSESRVCKISKDDLRMSEQQLLWSDELEKEITDWWKKLNTYWKNKEIPPCTCASLEGGFMAKEAYNPFFYRGEPCSTEWLEQCRVDGTWKG